MAEKFIPYEKLSKKEQKKRNARQRNDWQMVKPATQVHKSKKDYNRKREKEKITKGDYDV